MKIVIEGSIAVSFVLLGYIAMCRYLYPLQKKIVLNKNGVLYLAANIIACTLLLALFSIVYTQGELIHQIKLLILVEMIFPMAAIDYKLHKIPNRFILAALGVRGVIYIAEFILTPKRIVTILADGFIAMAIICTFFLLVLLVMKNSIGMGDIKLFAVMALYQGLWGAVNSIFFSLVAAFFLSLGLLISRKKSRKDTIAFGPGILVGTILGISLSGI